MTAFLDLPERPRKPRARGRTHILDKGMGPAELRDAMAATSDIVDLVKLGWGTSIVTRNVSDKVAAYREFGIHVCLGGTLFELCWVQDKLDAYAGWCRDLGVDVVEISDGTLAMPRQTKLALIERFIAEGFEVHSEVGSKDDAVIQSPAKWVAAIQAELSAGARYVILEGRESGTAGLYRRTGEIRMGLVDEILEAGVSADRLIFEAPKKAQQVWMIRKFGTNVNLANIAPGEAIAVETLRLGLRGDTLVQFHGDGTRTDDGSGRGGSGGAGGGGGGGGGSVPMPPRAE